MIRSEIRRAIEAAALCALLMAFAGPALADSHLGMAEPESDATPPPGTLGREGVVPTEGAAQAGEPGAPGEMPLEPIGHVPGPAEGVYGDPPNTGGTINPETRGWAYDPGYFFAMTRGLESNTDLSRVGRRWVSPWTLTFDVVTLPTAALAGLSGRAPAKDDPSRGDSAAHDDDAEPAAEDLPDSGADVTTPTEAAPAETGDEAAPSA